MSIREALEEAVSTVEADQPQETPVVEKPAETPAVETPVVEETAEQKAGRTAGRARDEHGRLLPGKAEKPVEAAPIEPAKPKSPPPSSWKKDHWGSLEKIATENPQLADYLNEREGQFAKGVSTYKQEYENVKPLHDAMQQFMPELQRHNIRPEQFITQLGTAHQRLTYGSPQEKLQMFAKLSQDYGVPLQALYDPQVQQQFLMQQSLQPAPQVDINSLFEQKWLEKSAQTDLQQFQSATNADGKPLYPHYETVRNTMAQLLDANLASDLKTAYDKAIRMHDDIWQQEQASKQAATQQSVQVVQAKQVAKAKAAATSPRTATPAAGASAPAAKGIRAALESAIDAHAADGGRV